MLVVETIAKIRRAYFTLGKPIKEICRELRISRKVVRKVIRSNATEFHYERSRQPQPRIGPWRERLEALLEENESKATRERLTLIRIYEELRDLGYEGSYAAVRRYAIGWREKRASATADAYVPLTFAPGEAYQFDWSHEIVLMDGVTTTVKVAHVRLCHSRMMFVRAYPRETQEMVFDAHERAFAFFKGACGRGVYDNMKTAVETIFVGKDRQYNRRFLANVLASSRRARRLHAGVWMGKGPSREPGRPRPRTLLHAAAAIQELRRTERLASRQVPFLGESARPSGAGRPDDLGSLRGGAAEAHSVSRSFRWVPRAAGLGVEDLPGAVRQQQILGQRERRRPPRRPPRLRRSDRHPPGRAHGGRTPRAATAEGRRSTIPGITCRFWRASRALCATARRSRTGYCRRRSIACGASSPAPTTATGRWSKFSPRCSPTDCLQSRRLAFRRSPRASIPPTSSSTSWRASATRAQRRQS